MGDSALIKQSGDKACSFVNLFNNKSAMLETTDGKGGWVGGWGVTVTVDNGKDTMTELAQGSTRFRPYISLTVFKYNMTSSPAIFVNNL